MGTRSKKNKRVEITPKKLEEIKSDAAEQVLILTLAYLMDEWDYDADRIVRIYLGISRYASAVKEKTISMNTICDIINKNVEGMNLRWNKK